MQYRRAGATGVDLSLMGYGCMRFSRNRITHAIDQEKTEAELSAALDAGVNYFDVAYNYPGCEVALGKFMAKGNRDRMLVATKYPQFMMKNASDIDRVFGEQLKRLQTDHIDFYLMHMMSSFSQWERLKDFGIEEWIARRKSEGSIGHIGFSYHGGREEFKRIVDAYDWDFCQIQLNYYDATSQAGLDGLHYAAEKGLPVIVMEPLRGGKLAKPPARALAAFKAVDATLSPVQWALQWLFDLPEVTCVLSGMNTLDQVRENCDLADRIGAGSLDDAHRSAYDAAIAAIKRDEKVGCTGCGYCLPCPQGVDIPSCFSCYNRSYTDGRFTGFYEYVMMTALKAESSNAGKCIGCGLCAKKCPQGIAIPDELVHVRSRMEGVVYAAVNRFKRLGIRL